MNKSGFLLLRATFPASCNKLVNIPYAFMNAEVLVILPYLCFIINISTHFCSFCTMIDISKHQL